ncbi:MAG TPA: hypothetical protein VGW10_02630 [Solirubrobacteraceae bacterium]|nr:hypothetical protein [Solirubrobacteraceae bacterium]
MPDVLRLDDDRGRFAGLAAILAALFVYALLSRNEDWSAFVDLLLTGVPAAALLAVAVGRAPEAGPPPGWVSAMLVAGFALSVGALFSLADLLGANTDDLQSSTATWVALILAGVFGYIALRRNSAICTLLAAGSAVVALLTAVDWIFSPEKTSTFRYVLLVEGLVLLAAGIALYRDRDGAFGAGARTADTTAGAAAVHAGDHRRDPDRGRHGVVLTVLAGIAVLGLALTFAVDFIAPLFAGEGEGGGEGVAWGWEIVVLAFGIGLAAFSAVTREPGPGYAAALLLSAFISLIAIAEDGFFGWPLVLLLLLLGAAAAALRPGDGPPGARVGTGTGEGPPPAETTREVRL